jgi:hypothetical protein
MSTSLVVIMAAGLWLAVATGRARAALLAIFIGLSCLTAPHLLLSA